MGIQNIVRRMKQGVDTIANLVSSNPVLRNGELVLETISHQLKIGKGVTWDSTIYYKPGILQRLRITSNSYSVSAATCGKELSVGGQPNIAITIRAGDASEDSFTTEQHFPAGGTFYIRVRESVANPVLWINYDSPDVILHVNEFGVSSELTGPGTIALNDGNNARGKLYRVQLLGGDPAEWVITEIDTEAVWREAKIGEFVGDVVPAYGSLHLITPTTLSPDILNHIITFDTPGVFNDRVIQYPLALLQKLQVLDAGDYYIQAEVTFNQTLVDPFLTLNINNSPSILQSRFPDHETISPTHSTTIVVQGTLTLDAEDVLSLNLKLGTASEANISLASLLIQRADMFQP
jgi:hypothetical protein